MSGANGRNRILGPDGKPVTPAGGLVMPDGTPAMKATEPEQDMIAEVIRAVASLRPAARAVANALADWRAAHPDIKLVQGQVLTVIGTQMVARWQEEALEHIERCGVAYRASKAQAENRLTLLDTEPDEGAEEQPMEENGSG